MLILPFCMADLDIEVDSYDSTTKLAKITITNTYPDSYSEIKLVIDDLPEISVVDYLAPDNCASIPQIIEPGNYEATLTTKEGKTIIKTLTFSKTKEELETEKERSERLRKIRKEELEKLAQKTQEKIEGEISDEEEVKGISLKKIYLVFVSIGIVIALIVIFVYYRRKKVELPPKKGGTAYQPK